MRTPSTIALACVVALTVSCGGGSTDSTPPTFSNPQTSTTTPPDDTGVTMENYLKLQNGMSYRDVVAILGSEGTEMSSNEIAGTRTVMYSWHGSGLGNMNAMFQNDKMMQKAQFGLK